MIASPLAWTVAKEKGLDLLSISIVGEHRERNNFGPKFYSSWNCDLFEFGNVRSLGAAENRVVPKEGGEGDDIYETKVLLTATLSCDHRVVDGEVGAQFLSAFKAAVEKQETLLL
jgi:hypothetical protein